MFEFLIRLHSVEASSEEEVYPYVRTLLHFDTREFLNVLALVRDTVVLKVFSNDPKKHAYVCELGKEPHPLMLQQVSQELKCFSLLGPLTLHTAFSFLCYCLSLETKMNIFVGLFCIYQML